LLHISYIFFRLVYCNAEQTMKACTLSVLPKVILDNYIHTTNKAQGQTLSRESNGSSATKEFPRNLWKVKVHFRLHKSPSLFRTLGHISTGL